MPERSLKPCAKQGCAELTRGRYCEAHKEMDRDIDRHRLNSRQRGYTSRWDRYRKVYLARPENALCVLRLDGRCAIKAECVDHIIPHKGKDDPLFWDEGNHQPACIRCNSVKGARVIRGRIG